ncbi:MAG: large-conductance mechanosensitive channel protein MscL [Clostridia bacterium]|nr:large-conductance mechanosensitive channel protein MscL [Clostridia bacterium]
MGFWKDFKTFAMRGNIVDMAVGVVVGGAFGKIVTSLVSDIVMPLIGKATSGISLVDLKYVLTEAVVDPADPTVILTPENAILYGKFIQTIIDFIIIAFCIFLVVRMMMKFKKKEEATPPAPPAPTKTELLLEEIRDLMKKDAPAETTSEKQE